MVRIYLAGPLFCRSEKEYNESLKKSFAAAGHELVLPQDNSTGIDFERMSRDGDYRDAATMMIFQADLKMLDSCDCLLFNLDGRVPDEGACVELGYAYARGKPCVGLKTDVRTAEFGTDNLMIGGALGLRIASSVEECLGLIGDILSEGH